jgi:putative sterol carrier protein
MEAHRRPDRDITPEDFFISWLPAEIERLGSARGIPDMLVRMELAGQGGGTWDLVTGGGVLTVSAGPTDGAPLVLLRMSVQDWRAIVAGEEGPVDLSPPNASPTDLLFVDRASQQLLATMSGTFRFEVADYNGRTWCLTAVFGAVEAGEPDATISTDAETYGKVLAREMAAPEAYFTGKITIAGDAGRGMQVGLALLPKM